MSGAARIIRVLVVRDLLRMVRQPSRLIATIGTPALVWVFLASGFARTMGEGSYAAYLLPGIATLVVLFAAIFGSIGLIQDRNDGFLRAVLVSPAPRWTLAVARVVSGAGIALAQASVLLVAGPLLGVEAGIGGYVLALCALACAAVGIVGIGLALAWWVDSMAGFHGVMNLVLMPMWLLSGAFMPSDQSSGWLAAIVRLNPLSHINALVRTAMGVGEGVWVWAWLVAIGFSLLGLACAWAAVGRAKRA